MPDTEQAERFARSWIDAFNSHDLGRILAHYEEVLEFHSPLIRQLGFNGEGVIRHKAELAQYFTIGLQTYPDLNFSYTECYAGVDSLVICYLSVKGKAAAETFQINRDGRAVRVLCHYR